MIISIHIGEDLENSKLSGEFYFADIPKFGDDVDIDGGQFSVVRAWHKPDIHYAGAKYAVLLSPVRQIEKSDATVAQDESCIMANA